jgi:hypothetical protein
VFFKPLRKLCKSEDAEETDSLLSTCFEKLSELLEYIRPFHFVVGVKSGKSFNDVLNGDTTYRNKNGVLLEVKVERNSFLLNAVGSDQKICSFAYLTTKLAPGEIIHMGPDLCGFCPPDYVFERGKGVSKTNSKVIRTTASVLFEKCFCPTRCKNETCTTITQDTRLTLKLYHNLRQQDEYEYTSLSEAQIEKMSPIPIVTPTSSPST